MKPEYHNTYYKVVAIDPFTEKWVSAAVRGKYQVEYKKNRIIEAPGIGVMCFISSRHITNFLHWLSNSRAKYKRRIYISDTLESGHMKNYLFKFIQIEVQPRSDEIKPPFYNCSPWTANIKKYLNVIEKHKDKKLRMKDSLFINNRYNPDPPFQGTICFRKIKVIGNEKELPYPISGYH